MRFCSACGQPVEFVIPENDNLPRHVCTACKTIHYHNPKIVAGCLPIWEGKILICKRAIDPQKGKWTLPAGFLENNESLETGALRETLEEANAKARIVRLHSIFSIPHIHQVHIFFLAELVDGSFGAGTESLEVKLVRASEIPWSEIAFGSVKHALETYLAAPEIKSAHISSYVKSDP